MFPWEGLPVQRNQEIYRMPSISSVNAVLDRWNNIGENSLNYPKIDPHQAFYVLNPDGSITNYQKKFEQYFKNYCFKVHNIFKIQYYL